MAYSTLTIIGGINRPQPSLQLSNTYERVTTNVSVLGISSTKAYGRNVVNGHYMTSADGVNWTDEVFLPATYTPNALEIIVDEENGYMYALPSTAKLYRAPLDDFDNWTEIQPPTLPENTVGRSGNLKTDGTYLYYGNYNGNTEDRAHVYKSDDFGATWTEVLTLADGKHIHSIYIDDNDSANIFVMVGDANDADKGLWISNDYGETWTHAADNWYGINMVQQAATDITPERLVYEGDGQNVPHVMDYLYSSISSTDDINATILYYTYEYDGNWLGTTRAIALTPSGDLFYVTTRESGGIVGAEKDALWLAKGPDFQRQYLLEDITGNEFAYYHTKVFNGYLLINRYRIEIPTFA